MARSLVISLLALLAHAWIGSAEAQADQKVIKDPTEFNAYVAAFNTADPGARAQAMETFIAGYPNSIVKIDAMEQAMAAYQGAGDSAKVEATARRILTLQPDAVRPLAIVVFLTRTRATSEPNPQALLALADQAGTDAERGLASLKVWTKPDGVTDAEFAALTDQMAAIFNGALGYRSLARKDYAAAKLRYLAALKVDPSDLSNAYQLAISELQSTPVDVTGFWWAARAYNIAGAAKNSAAQTAIAAYAKASYRRYHGSEAGWDQLVASAAHQTLAPAEFTVAPAPTPAQLAVKAVAENDPATLSISDWEFVLALRDVTPANHQAADTVWAMIQSQEAKALLKLSMKAIALTTDGFEGAISDDNQAANRPDVHVVLAASSKPPALGTEVSVTGLLTGYSLAPFRFAFQEKSPPTP